MKKTIGFQGITTTAAHKDGDCSRLVNVRKKNGVLKPVSPRKITTVLTTQYTYIFNHNLPQSGVNLLGVFNNAIYLIGGTGVAITTVSGLKSMTQIGNLVNVLDENGIQTLFWIDGVYNVFNTSFGGVETDTVLSPVKVDIKGDNYLSTEHIIDYDEYGTVIADYYVQVAKGIRYYSANISGNTLKKDTALGFMNAGLTGLSKLGFLNGFIFACYSIELFDGSTILNSNPVLISQAIDIGTRYANSTYNYLTNPYFGNKLPMNYRDVETSGAECRIALDLAAQPINECPNQQGSFAADDTVQLVEVIVAGYQLKININNYVQEKYRSLIKAINIYITPEVSQYDLTKAFVKSGIYYTNVPYTKTNVELIEELKLNQQFYKVKTIPFDDIVENSTSATKIIAGDWIPLTSDLKDKLGENLKMQEELIVDNFTHHDSIPAGQMVYNSKLHIWNYKQAMFHGFPLPYFKEVSGIGQFPASEHIYSSPTDLLYYIEVSIKTDRGISNVVRYSTTNIGWYDLSTMLSYPDSRATSMIIYQFARDNSGTININKKITVKLIASDTHNFAYYISPDLKPISFVPTNTIDNIETVPLEKDRTLIYSNVLKVSNVNNPFVFPSTQTQIIGTGFIRNVATNAMPMSVGQFGQYPLYVFTDEGIYSLDTGITIAYNSQSPASMEIPINDILCSTPIGVVFVGKRGIYIINGKQVQFLTAQVEETLYTSNLDTNNLSFLTFKDTLRYILYDYKEHELILVGTGDNWVLNLTENMMYLSTEKIDFPIVNNNYDLQVVDVLNIKDYSLSETPATQVELITRPIYFGVDEIKKLGRSIVRGRFIKLNAEGNLNNALISWWGSDDGLQFYKLAELSLPTLYTGGSYKDLDSQMMVRTSYRNYAIQLKSVMDDTSQIEYIDFEVSDPLNNDKMR